jgi:transcriptional regulator with XRE-family HTH domain
MHMPPRVSRTHAFRSIPSRSAAAAKTVRVEPSASPAPPDLPPTHASDATPSNASSATLGPPKAQRANAPHADQPDRSDEQRLCNRVRLARQGAHLSKSELARRIGVCLSAAVQWELAHGTSPTVANLARIAQATDVAFEWLATGRGSPIVADASRPEATADANIDFERRLVKAARKVPDARRELLIEFAIAIVESE